MSDLYRVLLNLVGQEGGGSPGGVPEAHTMRHTTRDGAEHVTASNNDGFEVWFGYPDRWRHHIDAHEARRLFWWLLVEWFGRARWFGLRRPIYYWALRRSLARWKQGAVR